ncbi:hypothetical protein GCM10027418_20790 [Mariniluteicoccus endophyticus]
MSELFSILVPLQTFPGWPQAPQRSIVDFLIILVAIPVAAGVLIGIAALGGSLARKGEGGKVRRKDPVWLGTTAPTKAIEADSAATETGGASVRW